jgi:hypothetical protein
MERNAIPKHTAYSSGWKCKAAYSIASAKRFRTLLRVKTIFCTLRVLTIPVFITTADVYAALLDKMNGQSLRQLVKNTGLDYEAIFAIRHGNKVKPCHFSKATFGPTACVLHLSADFPACSK